MPLVEYQTSSSNPYPQPNETFVPKIEVQEGDAYFTSPNTILPPPEVCPPVMCSLKLSPSDLRHRRWLLNLHPYLAFLPTSPFDSHLKSWFLTPANEAPLVKGSSGWHLPNDVAKKWKELEQTTRRVAHFLNTCALKKHPQFRRLWTTPEKPGHFGYFEVRKTESEARQSLEKSIDAFIIFIAYMAFLNCLLSTDPLFSFSRQSMDDIIATYSSENLSLDLHPTWIQTCLPPLIDLQISRVGCVIDVPSCTWIGLVPYLLEVNIPVWLYWGSPPIKPVDKGIIPWATYLVPSRRTVTKPVNELSQAASQPFPPVEPGSGQHQGETMCAYFERRKKLNVNVRGKETLDQRCAHLQKAKQQAGKPTLGRRGPIVYQWHTVDGVRIRQVMTHGETEDQWGHIPKRNKFYDSFSNQYDCCSEWSFDPEDREEGVPDPKPASWDPDDSDEDFDLHVDLQSKSPQKCPSTSQKQVTCEGCAVSDAGTSSTSNILLAEPESHHVGEVGTSYSVPLSAGLPGNLDRVDVDNVSSSSIAPMDCHDSAGVVCSTSATAQLLPEGQEDQEMADNRDVDEPLTSVLMDHHSDAGVVCFAPLTTELLPEDQEMVDDQNIGRPLTSLSSMFILPMLRWTNGGFVKVGDVDTANCPPSVLALEGLCVPAVASSPSHLTASPASQSGQHSPTASGLEGLEDEDGFDLYAASRQAVLDMAPISSTVIPLPDQDTFSDLIYYRFGYHLDEFPYIGLPSSFGNLECAYQDWKTVLHTVGGGSLPDAEMVQPAFADFLYALTVAESPLQDVPGKYWDLSSENHHALERIDTLHFFIKICRLGGDGGLWCLLRPKESPAGSWFVGLTPSLALECIRRGLGPSDIDLVDFLIDHGIAFHTLIRLPSIPCIPSSQCSSNPDRPILGSRRKGYVFDLADFATFESLRDWIVTSSPQGGPSSSALKGSEAMFQDNIGVLVDDGLSDWMLDLITGTYEVATGKGKQTEIVSWYPRVNVWAAAGLNIGYWSRSCEEWFTSRRQDIVSGSRKPLNAKTWRKVLRMNRKGPKCVFAADAAALAYLESSQGHVLRL